MLAFASMMGAALLGSLSKRGRPSGHLEDDTNSVVGLVANLFIVMTSLVLGLMLNSARDTLETNNRNLHTLVTEIILLDRTMGGWARRQRTPVGICLLGYVQTSVNEVNMLEETPDANASVGKIPTTMIIMLILWLPIIIASWISGSAQRHRDGFVFPGGVAHLGDPISNHRYAFYRNDPSV